jgi:hypothetical protein
LFSRERLETGLKLRFYGAWHNGVPSDLDPV